MAAEARITGTKSSPFFVLLMFDQVDTSRQATCIESSRSPWQRVTEYNRNTRKHRKAGEADWRLVLWIGPFRSQDTAQLFQQLWARAPRGLAARIERGVELAREHNRECYSMYKR